MMHVDVVRVQVDHLEQSHPVLVVVDVDSHLGTFAADSIVVVCQLVVLLLWLPLVQV